MKHLALTLDVVGLEHSGGHGEQRDCFEPADFTTCFKSPIVAPGPQRD